MGKSMLREARSIEQLSPEALAFLVVVVAIALVAVIRGGVAALIVVVIVVAISAGALDELVELTAVEPDAAAVGADIDLDAAALGDAEGLITVGAFHALHPSFPMV